MVSVDSCLCVGWGRTDGMLHIRTGVISRWECMSVNDSGRNIRVFMWIVPTEEVHGRQDNAKMYRSSVQKGAAKPHSRLVPSPVERPKTPSLSQGNAQV